MGSSQPPVSSSHLDPTSDSDSDSGDELGPHLTVTQEEQLKVESQVADIYRCLVGVSLHRQSLVLELRREKHIEYLTKGLNQLGHTFQVLDANRPWLCYWILHSYSLLGEAVDSELEGRVVDFLSRCQDKEGGYAGGPGQMPHLATTYAAVNTLVTLGTERALSSINRKGMYNFLLSMKESLGGFRMHQLGEIDARSCYCAISVASLLNILDAELVRGVGEYIASCQTYEGGIGGEPHSEAHGGYTFCGLAAMMLIDEVEKLDLPCLINWVASRQGIELGFQGRANKLVDGCYSFWQGAALALTQKLAPLAKEVSEEQSSIHATRDYSDLGIEFMRRCNQTGPLFHHLALQQYIILCSQVLEGGFRDKPGKHRDYYHTCYCLSGLSICQYSCMRDGDLRPSTSDVLGPYSNMLEQVHPLYNVVLDKFYTALKFFSRSSF
ncbi:Protein farnesyltransferase subunit beta [Rhynchospora pubera]|uniref:Protein farnesyltransferase subunit beta n=1 Tax=Rhynchospora pubera TaxID=906938 RepID=A0AAV8DHM2_9POAL|nr:Protein farnesyltransferase subunit beta [Rhynchospora pubera]